MNNFVKRIRFLGGSCVPVNIKVALCFGVEIVGKEGSKPHTDAGTWVSVVLETLTSTGERRARAVILVQKERKFVHVCVSTCGCTCERAHLCVCKSLRVCKPVCTCRETRMCENLHV